MTNKIGRPVAILGGMRTPFCRSNTAYQEETNLSLMGTALDGLVSKYKLRGMTVGEAVGGAVVTHAKDWNLAREGVIGSKLSPETPGITHMPAFGTSLQAVMGRWGRRNVELWVHTDYVTQPSYIHRTN